jgi:Skp family chaperone for outer membrane proteins
MWRKGLPVSSSVFSVVSRQAQSKCMQQRVQSLSAKLKDPSLRRCSNTYHSQATQGVSNGDILVKLGALIGIGSGGYYLYSHEQERRRLYRLAHSTYRILNLVGTTTIIGLDYAISLALYHRFQRNNLQTEYELKYSLLQKLQGDQQTITMKLTQCKRMLQDMDRGKHSSSSGTSLESGGTVQNREQLQRMIQLYQQQIQENRQEMEKLSKELEFIYKGNQKEDGYEQFYSQLHRRNAKRLRDMCAANGGVYIKIGQHIAMLDHVVPPEYHEYLCTLLANTPTSSIESVRRIFQEDFHGQLPEDIFDEFDPIPIASASLAQVHVATKNNIKYAIKVQHEGLREGTDVDRYVITTLVHYLHAIFPAFNYDWITKEMNSNIPPELDFQHEKRNILQAKQTLSNFIEKEDIAIPTPYDEYSSSRVITMSFEEGVYISRIHDYKAYDLNPTEISTLISKVFAEQIFKHGFVHCGTVALVIF